MSRSGRDPRVAAAMQILVSLFGLFFGIAILTAPNFFFNKEFGEATQKIASGWIGIVIGYWLS